MHFNATFRGEEGHPIFIGLNVGSEGVAFGCKTVNAQNDSDQKFLEFLDSDVFKAGLHLASTLQPAIAPLIGMALGVTSAIAQRNQNVAVQEFLMGLDFRDDPMGARLAEGSYLAVQIPQPSLLSWDWNEWVFNQDNGQVVKKADPTQLIPDNYLIFGVAREKTNDVIGSPRVRWYLARILVSVQEALNRRVYPKRMEVAYRRLLDDIARTAASHEAQLVMKRQDLPP